MSGERLVIGSLPLQPSRVDGVGETEIPTTRREELGQLLFAVLAHVCHELVGRLLAVLLAGVRAVGTQGCVGRAGTQPQHPRALGMG